MDERIPAALAIAGSDPTGGAGLQLDLQVFAVHGVHGMGVPTALTVQTTERVHRVLPAFPNVVGEMLAALLDDLQPASIKIGMLATDDVLLRVADVLERTDAPRVVDPVLRASDGTPLLEGRALRNLAERIVRGAALVTPNLDEAEALTGFREPERAARALLDMGARAALVKGGHAKGDADDFLLAPGVERWLRAARQPVEVHGTGCALSSAIAARLARGEDLPSAVEGAKRWLDAAIRGAWPAGRGRRLLRLGTVFSS